MGAEIDREAFDEEDFARFERRLRDSLAALEQVLERPGFGVGQPSIGAELELNLVGADGRPYSVNRAVLTDAHDRRLALEIDAFNLEINTAPTPLAGASFSALASELEEALAATRVAASRHGARVVTI